MISTVAGTGLHGYAGDGGLAQFAELDSPSAIAVDKTGALYIAIRAIIEFDGSMPPG